MSFDIGCSDEVLAQVGIASLMQATEDLTPYIEATGFRAQFEEGVLYGPQSPPGFMTTSADGTKLMVIPCLVGKTKTVIYLSPHPHESPLELRVFEYGPAPAHDGQNRL